MAVNLHERDIRVEAERNGIVKGIAQGAHDASVQNARNALAMNLSPEQVAQITGLSLDEVLALQKKKNA